MTCFLPVWKGDVPRLRDLLQWIKQLGGCPNHRAVIVADADTPVYDVLDLRELAAKAFKCADIVSTESVVTGWPIGPNSLFLKAAKAAKEIGEEWFFCEPDATPLCAGWLDSLEIHYRATGAKYLGNLIPCSTPGLPPLHLAGVAVYPPSAYDELHSMIEAQPTVAFDLSTAPLLAGIATETNLVQNLWGEKDNPPRFAAKRIPKTSVFDLDYLRPEAVIFHRNKDGSLIKLLRGTLPEIAVVFSFCAKDETLMLKSLTWMAQMHGKLDRTAVLHFDGGVNHQIASRIVSATDRVFERVLLSSYPTPQRPWIGWPAACNFAFARACEFIDRHVRKPWLWFEADMVAVVPNWLEQIEAEYFAGGKLFMGTVIGDFDGLKMGHINGTAVYPVEAAKYIPIALANPRYPWDAGMRDEMIHLSHRGNHLMQHCGAVFNGCCKPANGPQAKFLTQADVTRLLEPTAVTFHPSKDGSLIDRLWERQHLCSLAS